MDPGGQAGELSDPWIAECRPDTPLVESGGGLQLIEFIDAAVFYY